MKSLPLITCLLSAALAASISAQGVDKNYKPEIRNSATRSFPRDDTGDFFVGDVRGTIQNKALFLPKPLYPEEARRAGVEGAVRVEVKISQQGSVTNVAMLSGDPLLRTYAEDAASRSKFRPLLDSNGRAMATEGTLSYTFEIRRAGWTRVGADLRTLESPSASVVPIPVLAKSFKPDWTNELAMLGRLSEIINSPAPRLMRLGSFTVDDKGQQSQTRVAKGTMAVLLPVPSAEHRAMVQNLTDAVKNQLADDELGLWQFELGLDLVTAFYVSSAIQTPRNNNPNRHAEAANIIRNRLSRVPRGVPDEVTTALNRLQTLFEIEKRTKTEDDEIAAEILAILRGGK